MRHNEFSFGVTKYLSTTKTKASKLIHPQAQGFGLMELKQDEYWRATKYKRASKKYKIIPKSLAIYLIKKKNQFGFKLTEN